MVRTSNKKTKMDTTKPADEKEDGASEESNVQTEPIPKADETTNTNLDAQQEENIRAEEVGNNSQVDVNSLPVGEEKEEEEVVEQNNQVVRVDASLKNALQKAFSRNVASGGTITYGILREGIMRPGEKVLHDFRAPCLTHKKGMLFSSGYQHSYSFKSIEGEDITSYSVIAEDVNDKCITADLVDGGIGMKHIQFVVKSRKEGPWKYRVVICGK